MPLIDKPLPELHKYRGTNPKPKDFDRFWDASLREMRAVNPRLELKPADFRTSYAECFHLYFTGVGGSRIHAKFSRPRRARGKAPAVVFFHGYSGNSGDWSSYMPYVAEGFTIAALDCRGQGGKSQDLGGTIGNTYKGQIIRGLDDEPRKLLFRHIYLDTAQLAGLVMGMPQVDPKRVGATGGSQGGGLTLACAALEPRIKRAASTFPFLCDYQRVWEMDLAVAAYEELKTYFRLFDPKHQRETEVWQKLGYIDCQHLAPRIRAEVKMAVGLMDTVCPPSTQFAAYNRIRSKKHLVIYPDFAHEGLPGLSDEIFQFMMGL